MNNEYLPFRSEILEVIKHADMEYTFRMSYDRGKEHPVKPGQFFEISIPKYGEAPISVSGITDHSLDFTIRKVGSLTDVATRFCVASMSASEIVIILAIFRLL